MRRSLPLAAVVLAALSAVPTAGAAEGRIVVERAGRIDVIDPQGRPTGRLLRGLPGVSQAAWSADGARLAFVRDDAVWVAAGDGTGPRRLIDGGLPAWSPDGRTLAVTRSRPEAANGLPHADVWVVDVDSGEGRLLPLAADAIGASWFPDGRHLATTEWIFSIADEVSFVTLVAADGSGARRLTDGGLDSSPVVSPDGSRIAFASARDRTGEPCRSGCERPTELYVMAADGTAPTRLSRTADDDRPLTWSPDGARLVATRRGDLVELNADGRCATWLTRSIVAESAATWRSGPAVGPLDCAEGPAFPPPPEGPSHHDLTWLRTFTTQPVWWLGSRVGSQALRAVVLLGNDSAVALYTCRPYVVRCRVGPEVQTVPKRAGLPCEPRYGARIRAVRVRGRTAWFAGGWLHLALGRHWVRIQDTFPGALHFALHLRNGARAGPHPRLDQPLPAPAPGMVGPDCPVAPL